MELTLDDFFRQRHVVIDFPYGQVHGNFNVYYSMDGSYSINLNYNENADFHLPSSEIESYDFKPTPLGVDLHVTTKKGEVIIFR